MLGYDFDSILIDATGAELNPRMARTIWAESRHPVLLAPYLDDIIAHSARAAILGIILAWQPRRARLPRVWALPSIVCMIAIGSIIVRTKGATQEFPAPLSALPMIALAVLEDTASPSRVAGMPPDAVAQPVASHIVLVVDESVRGDYLQINDAKRTNTPFLASRRDELINFGIAISAANCSAAARKMIRDGTRQGEIGQGPSTGLFAHAKRAGYRTVVIDAWKDVAAYSSASDWAFIDEYIPITVSPPHDRDHLAALQLAKLLDGKQPTFVYVSKFGIHYPYNLSYPDAQASTNNRLARSLISFVGFSRPSLAGWDEEDQARMREQYEQAIKWSVDGFFAKLNPKVNWPTTLLIYTSDHGQTLWEKGYTTTHCSTRAPYVAESYVPMLAFTGVKALEPRLRHAAAKHRDKASHFDMFATLLLGMGFAETYVLERTDSSLIHIPTDRRRKFLIGGSKGTGDWSDGAEWVKAD